MYDLTEADSEDDSASDPVESDEDLDSVIDTRTRFGR